MDRGYRWRHPPAVGDIHGRQGGDEKANDRGGKHARQNVYEGRVGVDEVAQVAVGGAVIDLRLRPGRGGRGTGREGAEGGEEGRFCIGCERAVGRATVYTAVEQLASFGPVHLAVSPRNVKNSQRSPAMRVLVQMLSTQKKETRKERGME